MNPDNLPPSEAEETPQRVHPWASLTFQDYRYLWISSFGLATSQQMLQVTNLYVVYELSGSAIQLGLTGLFQAIPILAIGIFSGALADVFDKRKLLSLVMIGGLGSSLILATLANFGSLEVWHIFAFTSLASAITIISGPSRISYMSRMVPNSHLLNAITLNSTLTQISFFIGPIVAGVSIDLVGINNAYLINSLLYLPSLITLWMIKTPGSSSISGNRVSLKVVYEGMHFVWKTQILLSLFLLDFGVVIFGFFRPLLPILAKDIFHVGASGLGILYAAPAVGSVVGSSSLLILGDIRRKGIIFLAAILLYSLSLMGLGSAAWFSVALFAAGALGFSDSLSVAVRQTLTQSLAPDRLRGRTASYSTVFATLGNAFGAMEAGFVAGLIGAQSTLVFGGGAAAIIVLLGGFAWKHIWKFQAR